MNLNNPNPNDLAKIEVEVEAKVGEIVKQLKASNTKFNDPDFGPNENDEFGSQALYGTMGKVDSKYPPPESLRWDRPIYDDKNFITVVKKEPVEGEEGEAEEEEEEVEGPQEDEEGGVSIFTSFLLHLIDLPFLLSLLFE